jgi:hypothetical protein
MTPGRPSDNRLRIAGLATGATLLLLVAASAGGEGPPGCSGSTLDADILFPPIFAAVECGTTVPFTVRVTNGTAPGDCDISDLPVTFFCPDPATGAPTGPQTILATADNFTADPPSSQTYPFVPCVIGNVSGDACSCDSTTGFYQVQLDAGPGRVELNPDVIDTIEILKTASIACVTATSVSTTTTTTTTTTSTTLISLSFQCYATKSQAAPSMPPVILVDPFGSSSVGVRRPERLCAPVDTNGETPGAPQLPDHLVGYDLRQTQGVFSPRPNLEVTNQFGTIHVDARRFGLLLVPAAKSLVEPPPPLAATSVAHFLCYKVRRTSGSAKFIPESGVVQLIDQFGTKTVNVVKPRLLCNPVNGESPAAETHPTPLLCYTIKAGRENLSTVFTNDQFGPRDALELIRRSELCVPSTVTE